MLILSSALCASQSEADLAKLKAEIAKAKEEKENAEKKLEALKAKLPQDTSLKTHTQLGYIATNGNTRTENFSLDTKWKKEWKKILLLCRLMPNMEKQKKRMVVT